METLDQNPLTSVEHISGDRKHPFTFQRDNATAHCARLTEQWLENNEIRNILWPSQSADLNSLENLCDFV